MQGIFSITNVVSLGSKLLSSSPILRIKNIKTIAFIWRGNVLGEFVPGRELFSEIVARSFIVYLILLPRVFQRTGCQSEVLVNNCHRPKKKHSPDGLTAGYCLTVRETTIYKQILKTFVDCYFSIVSHRHKICCYLNRMASLLSTPVVVGN